MSSGIPKARYDDDQQSWGRQIHQHDEGCKAFGCDLQEGLPNNQNWDKKNIVGQSPIDRAGDVARRVKSRASELVGSLKEHFDGGDEAPAPSAPSAPSYTPPAPKKHEFLTPNARSEEGLDRSEIPAHRAKYEELRQGLMGSIHSRMKTAIDGLSASSLGNGDSEGHHQLGFTLENAARHLANWASGATTGGSTRLLTWARAPFVGTAQVADHTITGPQGETIGRGKVRTAVKAGDDSGGGQRHTEESAAAANKKSQGADVSDVIADGQALAKAAGTGAYGLLHKLTLTRAGEAKHGTKTLTLTGIPSSGGGVMGRIPDASGKGTGDMITVDPEHIQSLELHANAATHKEINSPHPF